MTATVKLGFGLQLKRGDGGSPTETFTLIAEMTAAGLPQLTRGTVDATTHESTDGFREFIAGLAEGGEIPFEGHYLPGNATHAFTTGLGADFNSGSLRNYKLVLPQSLGTWSFAAIVTKYAPASPIDGKMGLSCTLKISGKPTYAA